MRNFPIEQINGLSIEHSDVLLQLQHLYAFSYSHWCRVERREFKKEDTTFLRALESAAQWRLHALYPSLDKFQIQNATPLFHWSLHVYLQLPGNRGFIAITAPFNGMLDGTHFNGKSAAESITWLLDKVPEALKVEPRIIWKRYWQEGRGIVWGPLAGGHWEGRVLSLEATGATGAYSDLEGGLVGVEQEAVKQDWRAECSG